MDTLKLEKGDKASKSGFHRGHFRFGDMLVGVDDDQPLKMEIRTGAGHTPD